MSRPDTPEKPRRQGSFLTGLRNNFLAGIIVIAPIGLTVWLIWTAIGWIDSWVLPFVPAAYQPEELLNTLLGRSDENRIEVSVRGLGVVVFLIFTLLVGWIAKGLVGRSFLRWGEDVVGRLPVIRSIYNALKQIAETVFSSSGSSFKTACIVEFPCKGTWSVGLISSRTKGEIGLKVPDDDIITVFIPTTPNPTNGFLIFMPARNVIVLDMSVEDAAKVIISGGLVFPAGSEDVPPPIAVPGSAGPKD